ncbi:stage V sporulation protein AD [Limnochorda pilosa]|uniref:Stage V sporulation protein AD n=1 Tax=Limnochorda pilosa TaxID=1555112 RepID=A0A0K2SKV0_LIMPI|nr:stage V sporulation protein AD [Limnochorda pilosa]BAS27642.1 stage V sporulation protein AD [Limnochorda pilosa]
MAKRLGRRSVTFDQAPAIRETANLAGRMEFEGPLGEYLQTRIDDPYFGESSWEKAETRMQEEALRAVLRQAGLQETDVDLCITSDMLNQCTSCSMAVRHLDVPHLGVFSACASLTEGLYLAATALDAGTAGRVLVDVCSHHEAAERTYRFPTELGVQRPPTAQWTVTGAAAFILEAGVPGLKLAGATVGRVLDHGIKDPYDMGSAMAPAAADTLITHFREFGRTPEEYDLILTGDLARVGSAIARKLLRDAGFELGDRYSDCGVLIYDAERQDVHSGGSGMACSGLVLSGYLMHQLQEGRYRRVLLASTGALHSPVTYKQGESIPAICHAVVLEAP